MKNIWGNAAATSKNILKPIKVAYLNLIDRKRSLELLIFLVKQVRKN